MDLTIKLAIVGGIVWIIAIIIEWLWYSRHEDGEEATEVRPAESTGQESLELGDEAAMEEKVG